jgi:hypothetical protein
MSRKKTNEETKLQKLITQAIGALPGVVVYRNNVGVAQFGEAKVAYGVGGNGAADLFCEVHRDGVWIAVWMEVKTETGELEPDQVAWHAALKKMGRNACVVRSITQAFAVIDDVVATGRVSS